MKLVVALWNKIHPEVDTASANPTTEASKSEAREAVARADSALTAALEKAPEITEVAGKMTNQYETNHFAELLESSMRKLATR